MKRLHRWAIAAAILLVPSAVMATVVIAESIEEMARASTMVVRGRVMQVQPQLEESSGRIYTYADIQIVEVLKGPRVQSVLVKQPGGELNNRGTFVAGTAKFQQGQDSVLFLEAAVDEPGAFIVRSLAAGKVDLTKNAKGELRALRTLGGLGFHKQNALQRFTPDEDLGTPEAFLTRVRNALIAGGGK